MEEAHKIWKEHQKRRESNVEEWNSFTKQLQMQYDNHKVKMNEFLIEKGNLEKEQKRL